MGRAVSVDEFGARSNSGEDDTFAIQKAIDSVERSGGGTVVIPGRYRCSQILISKENVRLQGYGGWLIDGRLTVGRDSRNIEIANLSLLDTRGDARTYLMDIQGHDCRLTNVQLIKDPIAGGYQMYIRETASGCRLDGLRLRGSNGIFLAGSDHLIENFEFESKSLDHVAGDDAFAIKALNATSQNITIRNGIVRGYAAIVSFGSEIGTTGGDRGGGLVRNVSVQNVRGDRCSRIAFFKPGALDVDCRNGFIERVQLLNLSLDDQAGKYFRSGIQMLAARGAIIREVEARNIRIVARAKDHGIVPTSAIDLTLLDIGAPARIENLDLQLSFVDPYLGAAHGALFPGYPIDHVVRIARLSPASGSMKSITLDVEGDGTSYGGIVIGPGLDGAVSVERAVLRHIATDPPAASFGGGIWSDSRLNLGDVTIQSVKLPKFGGSAFSGSRH